MKLQSVVWNKLINKQSLRPSYAISNQRNKMFMMNSADDIDFSLKFSFALPAPDFQLLDCNFLAIRKNSSMDISESALSEEIRI